MLQTERAPGKQYRGMEHSQKAMAIVMKIKKSWPQTAEKGRNVIKKGT